MKSLEIVKDLTDALGGFSNGRILVEKEELEKVEQDLEVLEMIRKYLEVYIWQNIFSEEHELEVDVILKHIDNEEERYKVTQWLEENE